MRRRHSSALLAGALVISALAATGCSSGEEPPPPAVPWPLTGLPGYPEDATAQAITVKIENTEAGRPQLGIGSADIVVQELVEGGLTRLAVLYNSQYPDIAGPVRSMRETDIGIALPTGGTLAASGGSASTLAAVESEGVPTAVEGDPGFSRDSARTSPYNVMLDVAELSGSLPPGPPAQPYFPFGEVPAEVVGEPAATLDLRWPSAGSSFSYDGSAEQWVRTDLADPTDFAFTNVIALSLPVRFGGGTDASGSSIPTMVTTGSGAGYVATGGAVYEVTWTKDSLSAPWRFAAQPSEQGGAAQNFPIPPGRTWLALLPQEGGSVSFAPPPSAG